MPTYKIAVIVETAVAISKGIKISVGFAEPAVALSANIETGIIVSPEVLSARNII